MKHTLSGRDERTLMKLIVDSETDRSRLAHGRSRCGRNLPGMAVAMKAGATKQYFDDTIGIHPTAPKSFYHADARILIDFMVGNRRSDCCGFRGRACECDGGGGSIITVPIMMFLGVPGPVANGTNRITIVAHNTAAIATYLKQAYHTRSLFHANTEAIPPAIVGAYLSTMLNNEARMDARCHGRGFIADARPRPR